MKIIENQTVEYSKIVFRIKNENQLEDLIKKLYSHRFSVIEEIDVLEAIQYLIQHVGLIPLITELEDNNFKLIIKIDDAFYSSDFVWGESGYEKPAFNGEKLYTNNEYAVEYFEKMSAFNAINFDARLDLAV